VETLLAPTGGGIDAAGKTQQAASLRLLHLYPFVTKGGYADLAFQL